MSNDPPHPPQPKDDPLSVLVLALGIAAIGTTAALGLGAIVGLFGLVLGVIALLRGGRSRTMAAIGTALSLVSVLIGLAIAGFIYYVIQYTDFADEFFNEYDYDYVYEDLTYWEGVVAPPLTGETLGGEPFDLADHRGAKVVLYSIPEPYEEWEPVQRDVLDQLAKESNNDFNIFGLYRGTQADYDQTFANTSWLYPIVLTEAVESPWSNLAMEEEVILIVDRNGTLQHIFMEQLSFDELREAARGPGFEGEPADLPPSIETGLAIADVPLEPRVLGSVGMDNACHIVAGTWDDHEFYELFAAVDCMRLARFADDATPIDLFELPENAYNVAIGRYEGRPRVLAYAPWDYTIYVLDESGTIAWQHEADGEILKARWIDLDGDGTHEVVYNVDYNMELSALSADGDSLWNASNLDEIYALDAVQTESSARIAVLTYDRIVLIDGSGNPVNESNLGNYYFLDAVAMAAVDGRNELQILALGQNEAMAYSGALQRRWTMEGVDVPYDFDVTAADITGDGLAEWAIPLQRNEIALVSHDGRELARIRHKNWLTGIAMIPATDAPGQLIVFAGGELTAYEFARSN